MMLIAAKPPEIRGEKMGEKRRIGMRGLAVVWFLAYLTVAGSIQFGMITFLQINNPNPVIIATTARMGEPFFMCENASLSGTPCMFLTAQNTGQCVMWVNFTAGNGSVAKMELTDMNGQTLADLTNGSNYTWNAVSGTMYAIRVTRLIANSVPGNLSWQDFYHN